ncbi:cytochrome P450 [Didymella exigua CBS 183.55]|uniref:Cytochrome P450 n=1 Tax=Didymella exigua CBS 183.55 TaxID=1150837 RepID=A0A6A5R8M4_9PLEO|nr:cytochrome P450 [Didymella exigua CBS 183.55]KAF1924082.1 cytochrome P450 [Didymella exigua CBS 183.55]
MTENTSLLLTLVRGIQNASLLRISAAVVGLAIAQYFFQAIYRLYFHPLRHFPGPKLAAISRFPKAYATFTGRAHHYTHALHEQYGEVVRLSPNELSFIHPDAWRDIYGHGSGQGKGTQGSVPGKYWEWYGLCSNKVAHMIQTKDPAEHARIRRIFKPAFSDRALKEQEPLLLKYVEKLISNLKRDVSKDPDHKFDIVKQYNFTTFDVMGDLTFGESLHMLDDSKYDPWVAVIFNQLKQNSLFNFMAYYPWINSLVKNNLPPSVLKVKMEHFRYSVERVDKRLQGRQSEGHDLWDFISTEDKKLQLSRDEMNSNATLFMTAGTETTATFLSGLTYNLLKNPDKMEKVCKEIRTTFRDESEMTMEAIAALPYLAACLKESFRVYPSVPSGLLHLTPANGSTICGQFIPPNTIVSAPHLAMYLSPSNFKEPQSFLPERWMGDERFANDRRHVLQPFSVGSRDCLGKNLAWHEMRLIATRVLFNFDLELCPESDGWLDQRTFLLWEKPEMYIKLKPVKR